MNIPLFKINHSKKDIEAIARVINRGSSWTMGAEIEAFEKMIADYMGVKYALVFSSGTTALHTTMIACETELGDAVIVPSFAFISVANAPLFTGGEAVFVDIEKKTFGLSAKEVEMELSNNYHHIKAIILMHYGGYPAKDTLAIRKLAIKYKVRLIEDACESFGAKIGNRMTGTFGDIGVISFCQNKLITTGEGGAIVTNDKKLYDKMKVYRSHGRIEKGDFFNGGEFEYASVGHNFRMSSITAALGISQMARITALIEKRDLMRRMYDKAFDGMEGIRIIHPLINTSPVCIFYPILLKDSKHRNNLQTFLKSEGISSKVYFKPIMNEPAYNTGPYLMNTEDISDCVLSLPLYADMTEAEFKYVVNAIRKWK